jgi:hypothetical protein
MLRSLQSLKFCLGLTGCFNKELSSQRKMVRFLDIGGASWLASTDWPQYVGKLSFGSIERMTPKGRTETVNV